MGIYFGLVVDLLILHFAGTHLLGKRFFGRELPPLKGSEFWLVVLVFILISISAVTGIVEIFGKIFGA